MTEHESPFSDELRKAIRAAEAEDKKLFEACQVLVKSDAWTVFSEALDRMVQQRGSSLLEPLSGDNAAAKQEFEKGTIKGLLLARGLPHVTIAMMNEIKSSHSDEENDDAT